MRAWYNMNIRKGLETVIWLATRRGRIDFYHALKVLYFADKKHLTEYGRPILGDVYEALPHGPVARTVYALMKQDDPIETQFLAERAALSEQYPLVLKDRYWVSATREPDLSEFSESDLDALEWSFEKYIDKSFDELERLTHAEKAWLNARERGGTMNYEDMLDFTGNEQSRAKGQLTKTASGFPIRKIARVA